jgi:tetratricopeptide (TPR) repeat protein
MLRNMILGVCLMACLVLAADPKLLKDAKAKLDAKKFDEAISLLEPAYKANPKDAQVTKLLTDAHLQYGDFYMHNEQLPPRQKYGPALKEYRAVLTYDKDNKAAQANIKTIEDIYKSMGRPIPQ